MKNRNTGWCVIEVDREITRYYRYWLKSKYHIHLQPPSWDAHISCVRGERVQNRELWKKYHNHVIEFEYEHGIIHKCRSGRSDIVEGGDYYYINVSCPTIDEIRDELGLTTGFNYHLTIGRTHEYEARVPKRPIKK